MNVIFKRRSVRKYSNRRITDDAIMNLLRAAMQAPSAGHERPWEFIVIRDRENMKRIMDIHPYAGMLNEADCVIVICGNTQHQKIPSDFWIQDCSAATQNILLEATDLKIGSVWLGVYPVEERVLGFQKILNLPEYVLPLSAVALGYPLEEPEENNIFIPERIHYEKW